MGVSELAEDVQVDRSRMSVILAFQRAVQNCEKSNARNLLVKLGESSNREYRTAPEETVAGYTELLDVSVSLCAFHRIQ